MKTNPATSAAPVLRVETAVRARIDGRFVSPETAGVVAETVTAAFVLRFLAPPKRDRTYSTRPLTSRLRAGRRDEAWGLRPVGSTEAQAKRENRL